MKTFKDSAGTEWTVNVTVATVKRVKDLCGVNLMDVVGGELLKELASDPVKLVDTLYVICKPQATERSVTDEQFAERLSGDSLADATEAFLQGLADFFPQPQRGIIQKLLTKRTEFNATVQTAAEQRIDTLASELTEKIASDFATKPPA
jgi:hypothetical protein